MHNGLKSNKKTKKCEYFFKNPLTNEILGCIMAALTKVGDSPEPIRLEIILGCRRRKEGK